MDDAILPSGSAIVGTCTDMCPRQERTDREQSRDLSYFEQIPGTGSNAVGDFARVDHRRAVKKYARSAAGREILPHHVRTEPTLIKTMGYLLDNIVDNTEKPFHDINFFVSDRFRGIRQDYVCQNLDTPSRLIALQYQVRYYILAGYLLCDAPLDNFSPKQNFKAISDCLIDIIHLYQSGLPTQHAAEFYAYHILTTMKCVDIPVKYLSTPPIQLALQILFYVNNSYWHGILELLQSPTKCPFPFCCLIMIIFLSDIRRSAIQAICRSYTPLSLNLIMDKLLLSKEDAVAICFSCRINPFNPKEGINPQILREYGYDPDFAIERWGVKGPTMKYNERTLYLPPEPRVRHLHCVTAKMMQYPYSQVIRMSYDDHMALLRGQQISITNELTGKDIPVDLPPPPPPQPPRVVLPSSPRTAPSQSLSSSLSSSQPPPPPPPLPPSLSSSSKIPPPSSSLPPTSPFSVVNLLPQHLKNIPYEQMSVNDRRTALSVFLNAFKTSPTNTPITTDTIPETPSLIRKIQTKHKTPSIIPQKWREKEVSLFNMIKSCRKSHRLAITKYRDHYHTLIEQTKRKQEEFIKALMIESQITIDKQHRIQFLFELSRKASQSTHRNQLRHAMVECVNHFRYVAHLKRLARRLALTRIIQQWHNETRKMKQRDAYTNALYNSILASSGQQHSYRSIPTVHKSTTTHSDSHDMMNSSRYLMNTTISDHDRSNNNNNNNGDGENDDDMRLDQIPTVSDESIIVNNMTTPPSSMHVLNPTDVSITKPAQYHQIPPYLLIQPLDFTSILAFLASRTYNSKSSSQIQLIGSKLAQYLSEHPPLSSVSPHSHVPPRVILPRSVLFKALHSFYQITGFIPSILYQIRVVIACFPRPLLDRYHSIISHIQAIEQYQGELDRKHTHYSHHNSHTPRRQSYEVGETPPNTNNSPKSSNEMMDPMVIEHFRNELHRMEIQSPSLVLLSSLFRLFRLSHITPSRNYVHDCLIDQTTPNNNNNNNNNNTESSIELCISPPDPNISNNLQRFDLLGVLQRREHPTLTTHVSLIRSIPSAFAIQDRTAGQLDIIAMNHNGISIIPTSTSIPTSVLSTIYQYLREVVHRLPSSNHDQSQYAIHPQKVTSTMLFIDKLMMQTFHNDFSIIQSIKASIITSMSSCIQSFLESPLVHGEPFNFNGTIPSPEGKGDESNTTDHHVGKNRSSIRTLAPTPMIPIIVSCLDHHGVEWVRQYEEYLSNKYQHQEQTQQEEECIDPPLSLLFSLISSSIQRCLWHDMYTTYQTYAQLTPDRQLPDVNDDIMGEGQPPGGYDLTLLSLTHQLYHHSNPTCQYIIDNRTNTLVNVDTLTPKQRRSTTAMFECYALCVVNSANGGDDIQLAYGGDTHTHNDGYTEQIHRFTLCSQLIPIIATCLSRSTPLMFTSEPQKRYQEMVSERINHQTTTQHPHIVSQTPSPVFSTTQTPASLPLMSIHQGNTGGVSSSHNTRINPHTSDQSMDGIPPPPTKRFQSSTNGASKPKTFDDLRQSVAKLLEYSMVDSSIFQTESSSLHASNPSSYGDTNGINQHKHHYSSSTYQDRSISQSHGDYDFEFPSYEEMVSSGRIPSTPY